MSSSTKQHVYCFGGWDEEVRRPPYASHLDVSTGEWTDLTTRPTAESFFAGAAIGDKIYFFGGFHGLEEEDPAVPMTKAEVFDCKSKTLSTLAPMPECRSECAAAPLDGYIYVTGGEDASKSVIASLDTVFRYDVAADKWDVMSPMNRPRRAHQLVALNGKLYAIGGYEEKIVEYYDPSTNKWTLVASTSHAHWWFGATVMNGKIYICSDYGFEVYTSETDSWKELKFFNDDLGRCLVVVGDQMWSVGGGASEGQKVVHQYDEATEEWTRLGGMNVARRDHLTFVVDV